MHLPLPLLCRETDERDMVTIDLLGCSYTFEYIYRDLSHRCTNFSKKLVKEKRNIGCRSRDKNRGSRTECDCQPNLNVHVRYPSEIYRAMSDSLGDEKGVLSLFSRLPVDLYLTFWEINLSTVELDLTPENFADTSIRVLGSII